jgi:hypothetical protein
MGASGKLRKRSHLFTVLAVFAVLFLLTPIVASAQESGTILGVVKDPSGAVVPNATVTITNTGTNEVRTVTTAADGAYRVPGLNPGNYAVKVEVPGFQTQTQTGLTLEVAQQLVANVTLQVGAATQQVTVTGEAPIVNTTTSSLGTVVNETRVADLPLNGRNYVDLTLLQPGVAKMPYMATGGFGSSGTWFSANGAPARSNNYTIDGAIMQNGLGASSSSEAGTTLGVDGIREYKVVTSAFPAEYGLVMGSQTVMVSKSGTNQFHGDVFEYLRNSSLDARNFFDNPAGSGGKRLPAFRRNNFGGSFGGPIKKDKIFFFGVYEGLRQSLGVSIVDLVLPAACHNLVPNGNNYAFQTTAIATSCATGLTGLDSATPTVVPPTTNTFLSLFPEPNVGNNVFSFPAAATQREDYGQMRVDVNLSDSDTMFGRYTIDDGILSNPTGSNQAVSSGSALPYLRTEGSTRNQFLTLSENHIFSPTLLNTLRLSGSRTVFDVHGVSTTDLSGPDYSFTPGQPMGSVTVGGGYISVSGESPGSAHTQNIVTASDDVFYTRGKHALQFGVLYNHFRLYNLESKSLTGTLSYQNLVNFMQGIYQNYLALNPGSNLIRTWDWNTVGFYAQDQIRATSRLTLNAGLRYEFLTVPRERDGLESRFVDFAHPADPNQPWSYGPVMVNPSLHNFQPRVGFAWDVFGNGETSIRSGFGLYDEVANFGSAVDQIQLSMPPYSRTNSVTSNPTNAVLPPLPLVFPSTDPNYNCFTAGVPAISCTNRLQTMEYNVQQPNSIQYNLTVEQRLPGQMALAVSYVGYRGIHLWQVREGNPIPATNTVNGAPAWYPYLCNGVAQADNICSVPVTNNPAYQTINPAYASVIRTGTWGDAWYNSLQVNVMKRLSHGLEFQSAYTWSKTLDTAQGQLYASDCESVAELYPSNPSDARTWDKGPSCYDVTHNWHLNVLYHFPNINSTNWAAKLANGWWVGNIVSAQTGFPFSVLLNSVRTNNGILTGQGTTGLTDRPDLGTDTVQATFSCTGTGSAFPGAPACSNGSVTYTYIPYDPNTVITGDPNMWFNPLMFRLGPAGQQGNEPRGNLRGPGLVNWDFSVSKDTALPFLGEAGKVQFRAEMFNILNHANFAIPGGTSGGNNQRVFTGGTTALVNKVLVRVPAGASQPPVANVGKITATSASSRQIQLTLKLIF